MSEPTLTFYTVAARAARDRDLGRRVGAHLKNYKVNRASAQGQFANWEGCREAAARIKRNALANLSSLLVEFETNVTKRGVKVHWAEDAAEAREIIASLLEGCSVVVKSKTMTTEEIHLNPHLEGLGMEVVETDLGEFVQQLRREPPFHFVTPCVHLVRDEVADLFRKELKADTSNEPSDLTALARTHMREKFLRADAGITGANFLVADPGLVSLTENEGNIRLTAALPKRMISLVGIEKIVPRLENLALLYPMLGTAGTGQFMTCYNTLYGGPRREDEPDGPTEWHVVLLDNGRSRIYSQPEFRESLACIRCGACLNVCPVYQHIGGFSYGTTYQGPIGAVLSHNLVGTEYRELAWASSLCGACNETCPVKIDLHRMLLATRALHPPQLEAKILARGLTHGAFYRMGLQLARLAIRLHLPLGPLKAWANGRSDLPLAKRSFREDHRS